MTCSMRIRVHRCSQTHIPWCTLCTARTARAAPSQPCKQNLPEPKRGHSACIQGCPKRPQHLHLHLGHTVWSCSQRLTITATITITVTTTVATGGPPFSHPGSTQAGPTRAMGV